MGLRPIRPGALIFRVGCTVPHQGRGERQAEVTIAVDAVRCRVVMSMCLLAARGRLAMAAGAFFEYVHLYLNGSSSMIPSGTSCISR